MKFLANLKALFLQMAASAGHPRRQGLGDHPKIFLNYAREDRNRVDRLYEQLEAQGFEPWIDHRDIEGGRRWDDYIHQSLMRAGFFLACLSNASVHKPGYVQDEREAALALQRFCQANEIYLIPVCLEACEIPPLLMPFQAIELFREDGFSRLCEAIRKGMDERFPPLHPGPTQQSILIQGMLVFPFDRRISTGVTACLYTGNHTTFVHPMTFKTLEDQLGIQLPAYEHTAFYNGERHPMTELGFMFPGGSLFYGERGFAIPESWPFAEEYQVCLGGDITRQLSLLFTRDGLLQVKRHRT
jgi:hypothetical protein